VPVSLSVVTCRQFYKNASLDVYSKPVFCILLTLDVMMLGVRGVHTIAHRKVLSNLPARSATTN
jgi:hypothetical protein